MRGHRPRYVSLGADAVTWRSSLAFGSYPLAVRGADGNELIEWLQGLQLSRSLALDAPSHTRSHWD